MTQNNELEERVRGRKLLAGKSEQIQFCESPVGGLNTLNSQFCWFIQSMGMLS